MSQLLQEYVDSASHRLRVDRAAGVIRGVKLLGLTSRNGRRYRERALADAARLYEGAKVNVNHPAGHPLSPRDYRDRLGVIRGVEFRAGAGLFGDLHFNPRHSLAEQLAWDAEHAPQNVGMSHNVMARTTQSGGETTVEAITKVQSIDLVADPATTAGLFEQAGAAGAAAAPGAATGPEAAAGAAAAASATATIPTSWDELTLESLAARRPDLVDAARQSVAVELAELRQEVERLGAERQVLERRDAVLRLLAEHQLAPPGSRGAGREAVGEEFLRAVMQAEDAAAARRLVEERAALVASVGSERPGGPRRAGRPRSRDPWSLAGGAPRRETAAEFAAAVRGR